MGKGRATVWICVDQTLQFFTGNEQNEWLGSCTGWSVSEKCRAEIDNVLATLQNSFSKTPSLFTHGCWSIAHEQMHTLVPAWWRRSYLPEGWPFGGVIPGYFWHWDIKKATLGWPLQEHQCWDSTQFLGNWRPDSIADLCMPEGLRFRVQIVLVI